MFTQETARQNVFVNFQRLRQGVAIPNTFQHRIERNTFSIRSWFKTCNKKRGMFCDTKLVFCRGLVCYTCHFGLIYSRGF